MDRSMDRFIDRLIDYCECRSCRSIVWRVTTPRWVWFTCRLQCLIARCWSSLHRGTKTLAVLHPAFYSAHVLMIFCRRIREVEEWFCSKMLLRW